MAKFIVAIFALFLHEKHTLKQWFPLIKFRARYQSSFKGKQNHAACQARYRMKLIHLSKKVMDHGSTPPIDHASMQEVENNAEKTENDHQKTTLICCFCKQSVSVWLRNDFLQRKNSKKTFRLPAYPQAP
jgi:hypothetical protein